MSQFSILKNNSLFQPVASPPTHAVVVIFDLEGFSQFFSQPDVQQYMTEYLNIIFDAFQYVYEGNNPYWANEDLRKVITKYRKPNYFKFLGDGGLYLWEIENNPSVDYSTNIVLLMTNIWFLKQNFNTVVKKALSKVPVADIPKKIRFGLAAGTSYKLVYNEKHEEIEYVGYCLNLASRLQNYCSELGFIASARLNISDKDLATLSYIKVIATKLKGFPKEIVIVDKNEYNYLSDNIKEELFEEIDLTADIFE